MMNSFLFLYLFYLFFQVRDFHQKAEEAHMIKKIFFFHLFLPNKSICTYCVPLQLANVMLSKSYCLVSILLSRETPLILPFLLRRVICLNLNINNLKTAGTAEWHICSQLFPSQFHGCLQWWMVKHLTGVRHCTLTSLSYSCKSAAAPSVLCSDVKLNIY